MKNSSTEYDNMDIYLIYKDLRKEVLAKKSELKQSHGENEKLKKEFDELSKVMQNIKNQ